jgi:hypothetical protein
MNNKPTATKVESFLNDNGVYVDKLYKSKGRYFARKYFFYRHDGSAAKFAQKLAIAGIYILRYDEIWNAWPKDSYWQVEFLLEDGQENHI